MRAARYHEKGSPEVIRVEELPTPKAGTGEVLIRIEAAGVNYGDVLRRSGHYYPIPTTLPHIPGGEVVGVIEEVGADVDPTLKGRRVFSGGFDGGYAEYVVRPAHMTYAYPDGLDPAVGVALMIQGLTAALILKEAGHFRQGHSVFVPAAAGGVGSLAVQLARIYGADKVIGGASSEAKRKLVVELGADLAIDYTKPGWAEEVKAATNRAGVDLALEMSGGPVFEETFKALKMLGRMVIYGNASDIRVTVRPEDLLARGLTTTGFMLGAYMPRRKLIEDTLAEMAGFIRDGRLQIQIGGRYGLADAGEAHRVMESRSSIGKLVILP